MSNDKNTTASAPTEAVVEATKKPSFIRSKILTPIKTNPKAAIAVVGGAALVAVAAFVGRATAPVDSTTELHYEPATPEFEETDIVE